MTDRLGKIDIQGPAAVRIMQKVMRAPEKVFEKLVYFSFKGHFDPASAFAGDARLLDGTPLLLSRSGYTGEVGFEIFVESEHHVRVWELLLAAGRELGLIACGLAARDQGIHEGGSRSARDPSSLITDSSFWRDAAGN